MATTLRPCRRPAAPEAEGDPVADCLTTRSRPSSPETNDDPKIVHARSGPCLCGRATTERPGTPNCPGCLCAVGRTDCGRTGDPRHPFGHSHAMQAHCPPRAATGNGPGALPTHQVARDHRVRAALPGFGADWKPVPSTPGRRRVGEGERPLSPQIVRERSANGQGLPVVSNGTRPGQL